MADTRIHSVGLSAAQVEGTAKVSGRAVFTADVLLPGMLWAKVLRSPHAHARILRIDTSAAQALPGVHAVLTAADLPDRLIGRRLRDLPMLARDRVRFIGEKVAVVAAERPEIAEEALNLIEVEYAELPAVFTTAEAMQQDAPRVHDDVRVYEGSWRDVPDFPNAVSVTRWGQGDIEQGFAEADLVFEHTFTTPAVHQAYMEPHSSTVRVAPDGRVELWISNKTPFAAREQLAFAIGVPVDRVLVHLTHLGGDFGGKGSLMDAPLAYFLAARTGRPVKIIMTYLEELEAGNPRHATTITIKTGVKRSGKMVARDARVVFDSGAYGAFKPAATVNIGGANKLGGAYVIPHTRIEAYMVYTNKVPSGHMRAPGDPQAVFALESHLDIIADELGMDRLDFRLKNVVRDGERTAIGEQLARPKGREVLFAAAHTAGWGELATASNVGLGIALFEHKPGGGTSTAIVTVHGGDSVELVSAVPDTGTGNHTVLRQIVAEALGVDQEIVRVVWGDTDAVSVDDGAGGSRVTHVHGQAALKAAEQVLGGLRELYREPTAGFADLAERAVRANGGPVSATAAFTGGRIDESDFCAQTAEVEVDPETGQVTVRKIVTVHDVGAVINPMYHQGQIEGGVIQGLGYALMEELPFDGGRVTTLHFGDYKVPNVMDIPELVTVLIPGGSGPSPYEAKSIGEHSNSAVAAAIANAVADAVGVRIFDLPITAEKVYHALQAQAQAQAER